MTPKMRAPTIGGHVFGCVFDIQKRAPKVSHGFRPLGDAQAEPHPGQVTETHPFEPQ